jgi:malate/lactate dehydrogenase
VPCIVSQNGVEEIVECRLPENELALLLSSSEILKEAIVKLECS